jgi:ParB family transcriptional regulator, chromosome partitioning protein
VIVVEAADGKSLEIALIENLQREDLSILEEAEGYRQLADKFGLTQEQIAERMGKSRASVANALRILSLPQRIRALLAEGALSAGHAKVLLAVPVEAEQVLLAERTVRESLSVRALEKAVERLQRQPKKPRAQRVDIPDAHVRHLADAMQRHFGTGVRITPSTTLANGKKRKGLLEIDFHSNEELDRLLDLFGITDL